MGINTAKTETELIPGVTYTRYVWAYNICGISPVTILSQILPFAIGQYYGGGIIFYIDGTGQHGLISATIDQGTAPWGCNGTYIYGTSTSIGSGQANTTAIINGCSTLGIAARLCDDLALNGYNDWFLPSRDELDLMCQQKNIIGGFVGWYYWSSSDYNTSEAYLIYFPTCFQMTYSKNGSQNPDVVRAVRAF